MAIDVVDFLPKTQYLRSFIECYRLVTVSEDLEGITIANGRLDSCITLNGRFEWQNKPGSAFGQLPQMVVLPLTRGTRTVRLYGPTVLISIKFFPHVLTREVFHNHSFTALIDYEELFDIQTVRVLGRQLKEAQDESEMGDYLDKFFSQHMFNAPNATCDSISRLVLHIDPDSNVSTLMNDLAINEGVSVKTIERRFKKYTGLSPKVYQDLVRFQHAANLIHEKGKFEHGHLMEALGGGYYDQSHFVKTCRKITGFSPRELFLNLPDSLTDFMVLN